MPKWRPAPASLIQQFAGAVERIPSVEQRKTLMAAQGLANSPNITASPANIAFAKANLAQLKPKMDAADGIAGRR